jgi:hypothetical protein
VSAVGVMVVKENRANGKHEQHRSTDRDNPVYQVVPAISWFRHAMPTQASDGSSGTQYPQADGEQDVVCRDAESSTNASSMQLREAWFSG